MAIRRTRLQAELDRRQTIKAELNLTSQQIDLIRQWAAADTDALFSNLNANQRRFLKIQHQLVRMLAKRELKEIELVEISVVEEPADLAARIGDVKSWLEGCDSLKDIEARLRDAAGFSRADATALVSRIKAISHGERVEQSSASNETALIAIAMRTHALKLKGK
jgi:hypothetical protein